MIKIFLIFIFLSNFISEVAFSGVFEADQLPLSEPLKKTFPKIRASCFIISNKKTRFIINEKNSNQQIHSGSFNEILYDLAVRDFGNNINDFDTSKIMNDYAKRVGAKNSIFLSASPYDIESKTTLYDMCCIFENSNSKNICFFKSSMSGNGCGLHFKNQNGCEFSIILYGLSTKEEVIEDVKSIVSWLEQFFEYKVSKKGEEFAKISIIYGKLNKLDAFFDDDHFLLLSKKLNDQIMKVSRYRTMIAAPFDPNYMVGNVLYQTSVFQNPISKIVTSGKKVEKSGKFKTILDSICYIIFGNSFSDSINKKIED